jgi:hypothetical protein
MPARARAGVGQAREPARRSLDPLRAFRRNAASLAAFGNGSFHDFFASRIGCQTFGAYGMDLAALCTRTSSPR